MFNDNTYQEKKENNIRTDKFKVSGSAPITNESGTLQRIRGAVGQLVGQHSRQEFEEFKVALKTADFITINGKLVWDRASEDGIPEDPEGEWDPQTKQKFEEVKAAFLDFSGFSEQQSEELQKLLEGLNRDLARYAQSTLSENYKFDNKEYLFCFDYPPSPLATLHLERKGLLFTYKLSTQSRVLGTGGMDFFKLNLNGKLKKTMHPTDTTGQTLCELSLLAQLDLSAFPRQKQANFEISIRSALFPRFQYVGSSWAPEIMQLENVEKDLHDYKAQSRVAREPNFIIDTLQKADIQMGVMIEKIIYANNMNDGLTLLSSILLLFNQALKHALLKNVKHDLFNNFESNLKELLVTTLHNNQSLDLLSIAEMVLVNVFMDIEENKLIEIEEIFRNGLLSKTLASAKFLSESPLLYLEEEYITDEHSLSCMASIIWGAIVSVQSSLEAVREERNLKTAPYKREVKPVTQVIEISPLLKQYLLTAIKNQLEINPFKEQFIDQKLSESIKNALSYSQNPVSSIAKPKNTLEQMLALKFTADIQIGRNIQNISLINTKGKSYELVKFIALTLSLFNQMMMDTLLKNKIAGFEEKELQNNLASQFSLKQLINSTLKEYEPFNLLGAVQQEFKKAFLALNDKDIVFYLQVFHSNFIEEIKASGLFVSQSPVLQDKYPATNLILKSIEFITEALKSVSQERGIDFFGFNATKNVTHEKAISKFFADYLNVKNLEKNKAIQDQLLIDAKLFTRIENFSKVNTPEDEEMIYQVVTAKFPPRKEKMKFCADPEKTAALWTRHPYVEGLNDGLMIRLSIQQFLSLYPDAKALAQPFLIVCDIAGGLTGAFVARHDILYPKQPLNPGVRIWKAGTNGLVVGIFSLGCAINTYLHAHPHDEEVSNSIFWSKLAPASIISFVAYSTWYSIPPTVKEKWFPHNSSLTSLEKTIDTTTRTLFYSGIINIFLLNFIRKPGELVHQFIPIVPGFFMALLHQTRFKERANWVMTYLIAASLTALLLEESAMQLENSNGNKTEIGITAVQLSFWFFSLALWTAYVIKNSIGFTTEYEGDPEIITRAIPRSRISDINNTVTMSQKDYQKFRELKSVHSSNREEIIQQTTPLLFSYQEKIHRFSERSMENSAKDLSLKKSYFG